MGCGDVFWCLRCGNVVKCTGRCVHVFVCYGYLFVSRGESDVLIRVVAIYSVWCGDVIMFTVVKGKLILTIMRYLFILFIMYNTVFFLKQLAIECTQRL